MSDGDEASLRVQLLGPVCAWRGDGELPLGPPQQQGVLAVLATAANRVVSCPELIDAVWGQSPPASAANGVHVYVAKLRRLLEPQRERRKQSRVLLSAGRGYQLVLGLGRLDADVFGHRIAEARRLRAEGCLEDSIRALDEALALWKARPLAGILGPWAEIERVRLTELRLAAIEERIEAMLALGCPTEAASLLVGLVREHPLRERFSAQLMLALFRSGRQADALRVFADARRVLVRELGIEPGGRLRDLHERILAADPGLDPVPAATVAAAAASAVTGPTRRPPAPRELPADVHAFTGRARELARLDGLVDAAGTAAEPSAPVIALVTGTPGVGKTALALRWAHRSAAAFPDGQLYADLRGYDPAAPPVPAHDALAGFLRAFGVADRDIPAGADERATRYRTLVADKRLLVVLDNAATEEQVRPLLPGTSSCATLVTSRDALAGLVARHGAARLELDLLPRPDAFALMRTLIGVRADAEQDDALTLVEQCARLPLALRVAAELAASHPAVPLAQLTGELSDEQRRLGLLAAGADARSSVSAVFSWSYHQLPAAAARAFRLLSLHPGADFNAYAAGALTGGDPAATSDLLRLLARGYLIKPARPGRYDMHDLMKAYAGQLVAEHETATERQAALTRLFEHCVSSAEAAMDLLFRADADGSRRVPPPGVAAGAPPMADAAAARAWLAMERPVLIAVTAYAAAHGWEAHATRLAATLFRYLDDGHHADALAVHGSALRAARQVGDPAAEATALTDLAVAHWRQGGCDRAVEHLQQAVAVFRGIGDRPGQVRALGNLGVVAWQQGRSDEARGYHEQALVLHRETGDRRGQARALSNLGLVAWRQGRHDQARGCHEQALALYRATGDRLGEARALGNIGAACEGLGRYDQAGDFQEEALGIFRVLGHRLGEARALSDLASARGEQGRRAQAADLLRQALVIFREIGDETGESETLDRMRELLHRRGAVGGRQGCDHAVVDLGVEHGESQSLAG